MNLTYWCSFLKYAEVGCWVSWPPELSYEKIWHDGWHWRFQVGIIVFWMHY